MKGQTTFHLLAGLTKVKPPWIHVTDRISNRNYMSTSQSISRVVNFSAGPAVLPLSVLEQIQAEMLSLPGVGSSVLEISHRSREFDVILEEAEHRIRSLANIPDSYEVLFLQGGAALQNALIPANLITDSEQTADYILTGTWGQKSAEDVGFYGKLNVAWDGQPTRFRRTPADSELKLTPTAAYVHLTYNETIQGVQFRKLPNTRGVPIVADRSSDIFCEPINVEEYGVIYACAQKNLGIAGVTILIMRKDLLGRSGKRLPNYLNFALHAKNGSRYNTPPTFAIYVTGLVCRWLQEEMGGLAQVAELNRRKADLLYSIVDASDGFFVGHAELAARSSMNVVFKMANEEMDHRFVAEAQRHGLTTLQGHRSVGGIRASIYNAMPLEGVKSLAEFMQDFARRNG
jgi:phosphoserine aminotransferase